MSLHAKCKCGYQRELSDFYAGKHIRCPECASVIALPSATIYDLTDDLTNDVETFTNSHNSSAAAEVPPPMPTVLAMPAAGPSPRAHPGSVSMQSLAEPTAKASGSPDAAAPLGTSPFGKNDASAAIFERPQPACASNSLVFLNLAIGLAVAMCTRHPVVGLGLAGIFGLLAMLALVRAHSLGLSRLIPVLFVMLFGLVGVRHARTIYQQHHQSQQTVIFSKAVSAEPKVSYNDASMEFVRDLVAESGEVALREDANLCIAEYFANHPEAPAWIRGAKILVKTAGTPLVMQIRLDHSHGYFDCSAIIQGRTITLAGSNSSRSAAPVAFDPRLPVRGHGAKCFSSKE